MFHDSFNFEGIYSNVVRVQEVMYIVILSTHMSNYCTWTDLLTLKFGISLAYSYKWSINSVYTHQQKYELLFMSMFVTKSKQQIMCSCTVYKWSINESYYKGLRTDL